MRTLGSNSFRYKINGPGLEIESLIEVIELHFRDHSGILLSGSQHDRQKFSRISDIDILVFVPQYSNIHSKGIETDQGLTLDVTIVPLCNIVEILHNESFDTKGSFLSMLVKGKVLKDPLSILPLIQQKAKNLYKKGGGKIPFQQQMKLVELFKLKKHFSGSLTDNQKVFLTCDLISLISELETIRLSKWSPTRKHKADYLISNNPAFTKQAHAIFIDAFFNTDNAGTADYIESYLKTYSADYHDELLKQQLVCVDMMIEGTSLHYFYKTILPAIKNGKTFRFSYAYPSVQKYHRKYKKRITLCYIVSTRNDILDLIYNLSKAIKGNIGQLFSYEIFLETREGMKELIEFKVLLGEMVYQAIQEDRRNSDIYFISCFCFLSGFIHKQFNVSNQDAIKIHEFIAQKWIVTRDEQENHKYPAGLKSLLEGKRLHANLLYNKNKPMFDEIVEQGIKFCRSKNYKDTPYLAKDSLEYLSDLEIKWANIPNDEVLRALLIPMELIDIDNCEKYTLLLDCLLQIIPLSEQEKWMINLILKNHFSEGHPTLKPSKADQTLI